MKRHAEDDANAPGTPGAFDVSGPARCASLFPMLLTENDVPAAHALSTAEQWNQIPADWTRLIRLEPSGCFAARDGGRLIGTVTTTTYGRAMAWIGMMIVHPDFRGQGIGAALMRLALDHARGLGIGCVKLDATPAGRPLYQSLGFAAEAGIERWQGVATARAGPGSPRRDHASLPSLCALDRAAFGADRSRLLALLAADAPGGPLTVQRDGGPLEGFALVRTGRTATYIGPVIATTAGAAVQLLDGMLARCAGEEVCVDRHLDGLFEPGMLAERGLTMRRGLTRMRLGPPVTGTAPQAICAIAGPAVG